MYCIYCGLTYFIPFLNKIYMLPATAVGMYGIVNQYGLKMIGGPVGGFMSDKVHKSAAKHIRVGFVVCIVAMAVFLMIPHEALGQKGMWMLGAVCTLTFGAIVFTMRAVFFAPMDEVKVPREITGAAMSMASLIIYLPNTFAYVMYGNFLDRFPGMTGFRIVFSVMIGWAVVGVGVSTFLIRRIKQYTAIDELTPELLRLFIQRIEVGERTEKYSRSSHQSIRIVYRDIGTVDSAMEQGEEQPHIAPPLSEVFQLPA